MPTLTASTTAQLNADITSASNATSGGFVVDLAANLTETANLDAINLQSGVQLTIDGSSGGSGDFTLHGAGSFGFIIDSGAVTIENLDISDAVLSGGSVSATLTLSNDVFAGNVAIAHNLTVDQAAPVTLGDGSGPATVTNEAGSTYDIGATVSGMVPGPVGVSRFINKGTLIGSAGVSEFYVDVIDTGTLSVQGGSNLRFYGKNNSFSGTYIGGGMIDYWTGSTDALGTINMTDGACTTVDDATINQSGVVTLSTSTTITIDADSWNFTSDNGLAVPVPGSPGGAAVSLDGGTFAKTGGAGTTVIACDFNGNAGTISVASGVLAFDGPAYFSEAISGAGAFSIGGAGNDAIDAGTTIDTAGWIITGANTDVTLNEALSYSGTFREQPGATLTLTPSNNLTLTHSAVFTDATIGGSGTLTLAGAKVTMNGGTIGADASIALLSGTLSATGTIANSGTLFASGGAVVVAGAVNGVTVGVSGQEIVLAGGTASDTTISSGGTLLVSSGGLADPTTIDSGGREIVSALGTDDGAQIAGGTQFVYGLARSGTVFSGAQLVEAGGKASATIVSSGGTLGVVGGLADAATIESGGSEIVSVHGADDGAKISGGTQLVYGAANGATVFSGAQVVESGGIASVTAVSGGGALDILSGGRADAAAIFVGGTETVSARGTDDGARISGGTQFDYGLASGAIVFAGAQVVESGGAANGTTLSGGSESISSGGTDGGAKVRGGTQLVYGLAGGDTVFAGAQQVEAGGTASNTTISSGGIQIVDSGGSAKFDAILHGGTEVVSSGGTDGGARISAGTQLVLGVASGATVSGGGAQIIGSGGFASGTIVKAGGTEVLESGGAVSGLTLGAGVTLELLGSTTSTSPLAVPLGAILAAGSGEVFSGFGVGSGNLVEVLSAGLDSGGAVSGGGKLTISFGGIDSGTTILKGGTEIVVVRRHGGQRRRRQRWRTDRAFRRHRRRYQRVERRHGYGVGRRGFGRAIGGNRFRIVDQ